MWIGRFDFVGGYGAVARGYLAAMEAAGIPYLCVDIDSMQPVGKSTGFFWQRDEAARKYQLDGPAILVLNDLPTRFHRFKAPGFVRRVGCTLFETDSFPIDWLEGFRAVDEVWVPTEFNRRTFAVAGIPEERLRVVGYSVDTDFYAPATRTSSPKVRLLYVVSNLNRKDPGLLIRAYFSAFRRRDPVILTIKTRMSEQKFWETVGPQIRVNFDLEDPTNPEIRFVSGTVSEDVMRNLYEETDVYVTTERAKGWDYPVMEAMSMGIPSISIDWSGSEFLNQSNAFLIKPKTNLALAHATQVDNAEMYFGHRWADVDEREVVEVLRYAVFNPEVILDRGKQCRLDVKRYSADAIGRDLLCTLDQVTNAPIGTQAAVLHY
jgi:glycosyltransferase involved in cell wall biosynthesis